MYGWIFKKIGWKFFAAGAATAIVGAPFVRPAAVNLVKAGLTLSDATAKTWNGAKAQTSKLMAEATHIKQEAAAALDSAPAADLAAELRGLRADIAAIKADIASKASV
jgi:hypothetical protein